jgi:ssDNA-binding Zn-finger/Zn-ribbon topoisomerase 1
MDYSCPKCGGQTELRTGKYGKFWGCIDYPKCDGTKSANPDGTLKQPKPPPASDWTLQDVSMKRDELKNISDAELKAECERRAQAKKDAEEAAKRKKKEDAGVVLKLTSCLQCPNHGLERDPSSGDSFDWQDESLVCYAARGPQVVAQSDLGGYSWKGPARRICGFSRNAKREYEQSGGEVPEWCPLRKGKK